MKASQDAVLDNKQLDGDGKPSANVSTLTLSAQDKTDIRATKSIKELQGLVERIRTKNYDERVKVARDKVVKYFVEKSKDKKANGKLGSGKGKDKTLDDILGKD